MTFGIAGAGALGTIFAASLGTAYDVALLVRDNKTARTIAGRGGVVLGDAAPVRVTVTHEADAFERVDALIVCVKSYDTIAALQPLRGVLSPGVTIVSIQNGIEAEEHIDYALGHKPRVALAPTTEAAVSIEPGVARRAAPGTTTVGWAPGHDGGGDVLAGLVGALAAVALDVTAAANIEPFVWGKLVVNAAINPVVALAGVTNGALLDHPALVARARAIATEVAAVAAASGVVLPYADPWARVEAVARATGSNRSSMLQDLERGRRTEVESILGAVVRRATTLGIPVPACALACDEVRARESA